MAPQVRCVCDLGLARDERRHLAYAAEVVVRNGTASISNDSEAGTWTIQSFGASLTVAADTNRDFEILGLTSFGGASFTVRSASDALLTVGGQSVAFGSRSSGFVFRGVVHVEPRSDRPARRDLRADGVQVPGRPSLCRHERLADLRDVDHDHTALRHHHGVGSERVQHDRSRRHDPLAQRPAGRRSQSPYRHGLLAPATGPRRRRPAGPRIHRPLLGAGRAVVRRSTSGHDMFYAGLLWSGAWSLTARRSAAGVSLKLGLAPMSTTVSGSDRRSARVLRRRPGGLPAVSAALASFGQNGLRAGRPFDAARHLQHVVRLRRPPIDEPSMRAEIDGAARARRRAVRRRRRLVHRRRHRAA